jgi:polyhydroxybutyrate depolymerase
MQRKSRSTRRVLQALPVAAAACLAGIPGAHACGADKDPCAVPLGQYWAASPAARPGATARATLVYFHGAGGHAVDIMGAKSFVDEFTSHGYVVIAPQGLKRKQRPSTGWYFRPGEHHERDELAFVRQIVEDSATRFHIDRRRVALAGESLGGSLVWYLACRAPTEFVAYAPVAGGFWDPLPKGCAGPVKLLHTHGWVDRTVPLEGRLLRQGTIRQGDIFEGLVIWRRTNGCTRQDPSVSSVGPHVWRRLWTGCTPGASIELLMHDGGHDVPEWWAARARAWFDGIFATEPSMARNPHPTPAVAPAPPL